MKIFREIKRVISQFIETEYWYRLKRYYDLVQDPETGKYKKSYWRGYQVLNNTWDGDGIILSIMKMKVHHMYHNLKHWSAHRYCYIDLIPIEDDDLFYKNRDFILKKIFGQIIADNSNEVYHLGNRPFSKDGYHRYSLLYDNGAFVIRCERCVYNGKTKTRKYSTFDGNCNFVEHTETIDLVDVTDTFYEKSSSNGVIKDIMDKLPEEYPDDRALFNALCWKVQIIDIVPSDMREMPADLKSRVRGLREDLVSLLAFYKKIRSVESVDFYRTENEEEYFEKRSKAMAELGKYMALNGYKWSD